METVVIKEALVNLLNTYKTDLKKYTDDQFNYKKAEDIWSIGQMYEHLSVSAQFFFLKNIKYCIEQRNGQNAGEKNAKGENIFKYNSFPPIKVKVPGGGPDPIANKQEFYQQTFEKIVQQIENQIVQIDNDEGKYKTLHVVFGFLNAKEWLQSFEIHHRHHLRQKNELEGFVGINE